MEAEVAQKAVPALQNASLEGDSFYPYLLYSTERNFLPWNHCHLCHAVVDISASQSWDSDLEQHTQDKHQLSLVQVRRMVLETETCRGSLAITAQVIRTCLRRFRTELSDASFSFSPCACCAHSFNTVNCRKRVSLLCLQPWLLIFLVLICVMTSYTCLIGL